MVTPFGCGALRRCVTDGVRLTLGNPALAGLQCAHPLPFITEEPTVLAILTHLGEPVEPPPISPCRGPPLWETFDQEVEFDLVHPEPEYEFDQRVSC